MGWPGLYGGISKVQSWGGQDLMVGWPGCNHGKVRMYMARMQHDMSRLHGGVARLKSWEGQGVHGQVAT